MAGGWGGRVTEVMSLSYEARVAVRGELASPKSFSRLIHDNKDDRDKRENTPEDNGPCWYKKKKKKTKQSCFHNTAN